jgi:hypothetical protein
MTKGDEFEFVLMIFGFGFDSVVMIFGSDCCVIDDSVLLILR